MSMTLNLVDRLLSMGRNYQSLGRNQDALRILTRLAGFREVSPEVAEETQFRLAQLHFLRRKYTRVRRHLTAALAHQPDSARYHYLMAAALAADARADGQRALEHYRKSLQVEPDQPACISELGLLALRLGRTEEGLASLRRAAQLAPDDVVVLERVVKALEEEDRSDEARAILRTALFRSPRSAGIRRLWNDFQYHQLHRAQAARRRGSDPTSIEAEEPRLLPFVPPENGGRPFRMGRRIIRRDVSTGTRPPHRTERAPLPDQRHAQ
jgi:tetratricopeptide (TPR) repeat protein